MLIYRQTALNPTVPEAKDKPNQPSMPNYLKGVIETTNATYQKDRETYSKLKNDIDIIIQDRDEYFMVTENEIMGEQMPLLSYQNPHDFEMKGVHCRLSLTDTLDDAHAKIVEAAALTDDFELFEVC